MDLDAIRYMTNTTDSIEAQACHMLADAVTALTARVAALEAAAKPAPDADPSPTTVTIDRKEYDQALRLLVRAAGDSDPAMRRLIVDAIDHLKGQN